MIEKGKLSKRIMCQTWQLEALRVPMYLSINNFKLYWESTQKEIK